MRRSVLLLISWITFCALAQLSQAANYSAGDLERRWHQDQIQICFAKADQTSLLTRSARYREYREQMIIQSIHPRQAQNLKNILLAAYPKDLTGMELQGFEYCTGSANENVDSYFTAIEFVDHDGSTGISSVGDEKSYPGAFRDGPRSARSFTGIDFRAIQHNLDRTNDVFMKLLEPLMKGGISKAESRTFHRRVSSDILALTVIHEFGHVLGLRHEDARSDLTLERAQKFSKLYPFCKNDWQSTERERASSSLTPNYDLFSVMNYCQGDLLQLYQRARFVCENRSRFDWHSDRPANPVRKTTRALQALIERCSFVEAHPFEAGLSTQDRAGLRSLYSFSSGISLDRLPRDAVSLDEWTEFFKLVQAVDPER